jgi:hypothetical protein
MSEGLTKEQIEQSREWWVELLRVSTEGQTAHIEKQIAVHDAALSALRPEGVWVPVEPTEKMLAEMTRPNYSYRDRYAAMLRAARPGRVG